MELWKLIATTDHILVIYGTYPVSYLSSGYDKTSMKYMRACVASPYLLLFGKVNQFGVSGHYTQRDVQITCQKCYLSNYLEKAHPHNVVFLVKQLSHVMYLLNT